jgi:hypothetical protein
MRAANRILPVRRRRATDHNSDGSHRRSSLTYLPLSTSASQHNARLTPVCELDAGLLTNYQPFAC